MSCFSLKPSPSKKKNTSFDWIFEYKPYGRVNKYQVMKRITSMYPDLDVLRVHVVKSLKRIKVIVTTKSKTCLW